MSRANQVTTSGGDLAIGRDAGVAVVGGLRLETRPSGHCSVAVAQPSFARAEFFKADLADVPASTLPLLARQSVRVGSSAAE